MMLVSVLALAACASACSTAEDAAVSGQAASGLTQFAQTMAGHYSSADQAKADSSYFNIHLHMVPIWDSAEDPDTVWLYVEQAAFGYLDQPYRQRVYRLTEEPESEGTRFRSAVFTLSAPMRFAGAWDSVAAFDGLTPDSLVERSGCDLVLTRFEDGSYAGSTGENTCPSALRGAAYATSEVTMDNRQLLSWDRGWDENGEQVWGAEKGGYVFRRMAP
jgi:hypothetical protein